MLVPWKESYDQPKQCIKKQTLLCWQRSIQPKLRFVSPVVMYGCESWTIKKAERWRIDAFKLQFCRRLLRVLGSQGDQISQSSRKLTLNIHWKDWCWSWSSDSVATWCEELKLTEKKPWCWERLKSRGEGDDRDEVIGCHKRQRFSPWVKKTPG